MTTPGSALHSRRERHHRRQGGGNPVSRFAGDHPEIVTLAKAGWAAKGVVYLIAGVLALSVAARAGGWTDEAVGAGAGTGGEEASPTGAVQTVAHTTGGTALLWLLALGMFLYALWRIVTACLPGSNDAESWGKRVGYLVSAVLYSSLGLTAIRLAQSKPSTQDGNSQVSDMTASVMEHTAGRSAIGLVGVIVIAVGVYRISKGVKMDVDDELDLSGMSAERSRWTRRLGAIGEAGRGLAMGLIGFFLVRSALDYDPEQATGLDGALRRLAVESWGVVVVALVGIGFVAYGVFCLTTFTRRRLEAA